VSAIFSARTLCTRLNDSASMSLSAGRLCRPLREIIATYRMCRGPQRQPHSPDSPPAASHGSGKTRATAGDFAAIGGMVSATRAANDRDNRNQWKGCHDDI
jgi:hypothetical protein